MCCSLCQTDALYTPLDRINLDKRQKGGFNICSFIHYTAVTLFPYLTLPYLCIHLISFPRLFLFLILWTHRFRTHSHSNHWSTLSDYTSHHFISFHLIRFQVWWVKVSWVTSWWLSPLWGLELPLQVNFGTNHEYSTYALTCACLLIFKSIYLSIYSFENVFANKLCMSLLLTNSTICCNSFKSILLKDLYGAIYAIWVSLRL